MSSKLLIAAIKSLEFINQDDESLANIEKSLNTIIDIDSFDGLIQTEAFCKLTEVQNEIAARADQVADREHTILMEAAAFVEEHLDLAHENDALDDLIYEPNHLANLINKAKKKDGLSFEYHGIKWSWNPKRSSWDLTPKK